MKNFICCILGIILLVGCKQSIHDELMKIKKIDGDRKKASELNDKGLSFHKMKDYKLAEEYWYQAAKTDPGWAMPYFNLACVKAIQNIPNDSLDYLKIALDLDCQKMIQYVIGDSDLASIRNNNNYKDILKQAIMKDGCDPGLDSIIASFKMILNRDITNLKMLVNKELGIILSEGTPFSTMDPNDPSLSYEHVKEHIKNDVKKYKTEDITKELLEPYIKIGCHPEGAISSIKRINEYFVEYTISSSHTYPPTHPQGGMSYSCDSQVYYIFKKITNRWYLVEISNFFNAGI